MIRLDDIQKAEFMFLFKTDFKDWFIYSHKNGLIRSGLFSGEFSILLDDIISQVIYILIKEPLTAQLWFNTEHIICSTTQDLFVLHDGIEVVTERVKPFLRDLKIDDILNNI